MRTAVLLSFPEYYTTSRPVCQYLFCKKFKYFSTFFRRTKHQERQAPFLPKCSIAQLCGTPLVSFVVYSCKNVVRNLNKNYQPGIGNNLPLGVFDENLRRYSSILILYKSQVLVYNIRADKPVSPRPDMPASFLAQYFVTAKCQAHDIPPCGVGHCCASFFIFRRRFPFSKA